MTISQFIRIITRPGTLLNGRHIFLLSHMRANTSLFGHILGSNPEINGYYELHIGYYSWKSLFRQKLKLLEHHAVKKGSRFFFDKVLHNGHHVNCSLLKDNPRTRVIISLRPPEQTIPSILKLYRTADPENACATPAGACDYYVSRLAQLETYAASLEGGFIYLDADAMIKRTKETFHLLETELGLLHPLSPTYSVQRMTGKKFAGDNSDSLKSGRIQHREKNYPDLFDTRAQKSGITAAFETARASIISRSKQYLAAG
ncbi:MAG: hypothetical protein V6Z89_18235 [Desulfobacter sp.]